VQAFVRKQLQPARQKEILDIGVGTGSLSHALYQQGAIIWGIDFSSRMLRQAKSRMPEGTFLLRDIAGGVPAEIQDRRFDAIVSSYAVHHIEQQDLLSFLRDYIELLQPGGLLLIADIGFETRDDRERVQQQCASIWDDSENYLIGDEILGQLQPLGVSAHYTQMSVCAGILSVRKPPL
jgi:putative AdoMet-dependent methyltransferase